MKTDDIAKRFIDEKELAAMTGFALQTIRNWRFRRQGPSYLKINRAIRYELGEVLRYMDQHRVNLES